MDKLIKILKIIFLIIAILIGIGILGALFLLYKGTQSGNLKTYVTETAIETVAPDLNLTDTQQEMLDSGNYEDLAKDIEENITPEQIDCATQAVGVERAKELTVTQDPTPQEIFKLSKCL